MGCWHPTAGIEGDRGRQGSPVVLTVAVELVVVLLLVVVVVVTVGVVVVTVKLAVLVDVVEVGGK